MTRWIRDWWRGWSDNDLESGDLKIAEKSLQPGAIVYLTDRELRAHLAHYTVEHQAAQ
jgi:hypothetical protein